jgi:hypothetical protein
MPRAASDSRKKHVEFIISLLGLQGYETPRIKYLKLLRPQEFHD